MAGRLSFYGTTWPAWVGLPFRAWFQVARLGCKRCLGFVPPNTAMAVWAACPPDVAFASCAEQLRWPCLLLPAAHDASRHSLGCCCLVGLGTPGFGLRDLRFSLGRLSFSIVSCVVSMACQVSLAFPGCPVLVPMVMSGHRWLGRLPHFGANPAILVCGCLALALFAGLTSRSKGRAARWRF